MASQQFAGIAVLVALAFMVMALSACASSTQTVAAADAIEAPAEFHGAHISADTLRDRLGGE